MIEVTVRIWVVEPLSVWTVVVVVCCRTWANSLGAARTALNASPTRRVERDFAMGGYPRFERIRISRRPPSRPTAQAKSMPLSIFLPVLVASIDRDGDLHSIADGRDAGAGAYFGIDVANNLCQARACGQGSLENENTQG